MTQKYQFKAIIKEAGGGGAFVIIPFDVEKEFGKKRVKIIASIEGEPYRGTLVRMGNPHHILIVLKEIREKIGKGIGDEIAIELEEDLEPRQVEIPADLLQALETNPAEYTFFKELSYTHQKEYVRWIVEAKQERTRVQRLQRMIEYLKQKKSEH